jgi:hypothetical protein
VGKYLYLIVPILIRGFWAFFLTYYLINRLAGFNKAERIDFIVYLSDDLLPHLPLFASVGFWGECQHWGLTAVNVIAHFDSQLAVPGRDEEMANLREEFASNRIPIMTKRQQRFFTPGKRII